MTCIRDGLFVKKHRVIFAHSSYILIFCRTGYLTGLMFQISDA